MKGCNSRQITYHITSSLSIVLIDFNVLDKGNHKLLLALQFEQSQIINLSYTIEILVL